MNVIEEPKKSFIKTTGKNSGQFEKQPRKLLYTVFLENNKLQKKEIENKPEEEPEIGLPPQPQQYIKYPEYDWF